MSWNATGPGTTGASRVAKEAGTQEGRDGLRSATVVPVVSINNSYRFLALLSKCFMICTLYLHLSFFYRCGRMECSSLHESKCADDSSEESREGPIVDVNVGRPGGRRGKGMNTRRNQSMMNYTRRGSGGSAGGSGGCPGSLEDCIAACPSTVRAFKVCTANCERRCSKK